MDDMDNSADSSKLDMVFMALAHPKRREMLYFLSLRPATVKQLAIEYDLSLPAMHKHIRTLEDAELIIRKKVGRTNFVALRRSSLLRLQEWVLQYRAEWGNDDETLENYIASLEH